MEELFFRGFLYPVLARWLGVTAGVFVTALGFGMLHAMQLGFAWGAVFIIFLVGLALTIVRAVTNSVGCSLVVHIAYNSTLTVLTFIGTDGFRHLERLHS
jgi:membrane protease YdiL (CAAX protease family)